MSSDGELGGRRALVTASSRGIGRAVATELAARGADVFITGSRSHTAEVAGEIGAAGYVLADFTDPQAPVRAVRAAVAELGGLDILVSNTAGPRPSAFVELDEDDWLSAYNLVLGSALALTREAVREMGEQGWGRIVYLTSTAGVVRPRPGLHLSNVMRAGIAGLASSIAGEIGPRGITVNVVAPGPIDTARRQQIMQFQASGGQVEVGVLEEQEIQRIPVRRVGRAEEVAHLVAYLCSPWAGFITGTSHVIDGGISI